MQGLFFKISGCEVAAGNRKRRKPNANPYTPKAPLGLKGPIPPIRGKWPEGPIGVGTLAQRACGDSNAANFGAL